MFFSSPSADINLMVALLIVALIISIVTYIFSRKLLVSVFVFSVLSNVVLYGNLTYRIATSYDILWLFKFVRNIFPYINLIFFAVVAITFLKKKYEK